ncbi:RpiB/LacA/LacB family sugar-phosphate isomerase [bacterium]|nr:RpiB/LacA/LacB family sugar-phosphate isomerase [bacterium]
MKIAFASDHAGFALKQKLMETVRQMGHEPVDFGCRSADSVDLSDFVAPAAEAIGCGQCARGVFVDGAGYPSGMIANMHHGVFAAVANDLVSARLSREHSAANVVCLGAMVVGELMAKEIVTTFLSTEPLGGKYAVRVEKVKAIGEKKRVGPLYRTREVLTVQDLREAIEEKQPLVLDQRTVITPSVLDAVRAMRP